MDSRKNRYRGEKTHYQRRYNYINGVKAAETLLSVLV
jgi:hypothetical protein